MVPQNRVLNRGLWADIEESTRRLATRRGALFVVTGVIFAGDAVQQIKGGVLVPTQLFKAVGSTGAISPGRGHADPQFPGRVVQPRQHRAAEPRPEPRALGGYRGEHPAPGHPPRR
ncbi:endonuclease, partial [Methylobacterium radiotolerans]